MGKRILIFNIIYYAIFLALIKQGQNYPSSSLGYGYFVFVFWIVAAITLVLLLISKIIRPESILQKIGIFTATPALTFLVIALLFSMQERTESEWYFDKQGYRHRVKTFAYKRTSKIKRIEYYRSQDKTTWVRDSTWLYFSESGDTLKRIKYKNDIEIK